MPWFKVTAERFDWMPKKNVMLSFKRDEIGYQTENCVSYGESINAVERIKKPKNAKVDKSGKVIWND